MSEQKAQRGHHSPIGEREQAPQGAQDAKTADVPSPTPSEAQRPATASWRPLDVDKWGYADPATATMADYDITAVAVRARRRLLDDRWATLMIGVMADGSQCPSGLADRIYDPLTDIACRMVHGLRIYDAVAPLDDRDRELMIASDREVELLEQLQTDLLKAIETGVKTFALGILELREPVR